MTSNRQFEYGDKKVHLGCGRKLLDGFTNIDKLDDQKADNFISADLTEGIPLPDSSVDYVFSEDFLEHLPQNKAVFFINEIARVLKPGGIMEHYIPNAGSRNYFASPDHTCHWNLTTFEFFEVGNHHFEIDRKFNGYTQEGFDFVGREEINFQDEYGVQVPQGIHVAMRKKPITNNA